MLNRHKTAMSREVPALPPAAGLAGPSKRRLRADRARPNVPLLRRFSEAPLFKPPGWLWRGFGEVGWWVRREWQSALLGPDGLRLEEWRTKNLLATVKTGPHRGVYRADLPEGALYIKHFKVPGLREILRQWMRRGKGSKRGQTRAQARAHRHSHHHTHRSGRTAPPGLPV